MGADAHTISVIICVYTLDRWQDICEAVESVRNQTLAPHEIVIVVDHNAELHERLAARFPDLLVVANREAQGLSGGRNTGIAASRGALVAFLDDDAIADPAWLQTLAECCERDDILGATARVAPLWVGERPGWLPDEFLWTVGCTYRGLPAGPQEVRNVFGGAMMMKRQVFERAGGFAGSLGRRGSGVPLSCEDTELCVRARMVMPNGRFMFHPSSIVWHKIPASRLTWTYFRSRCYAEGLSKGHLAAMFKGRDVLATERHHILSSLSRGAVRGFADTLVRLDPDGVKRSAAIVLGVASAGVGFFAAKRIPPSPDVPDASAVDACARMPASGRRRAEDQNEAR